MPSPKRPRPVVRAELVPPRYRLAIIEEPSNRIVMRLPEIPAPAVHTIADELRRLMPTLRVAAAVRNGVRDVMDLLGQQQARPPRARR